MVKSVIQSPEKSLSALREPQIISLRDVGAEGFFYPRVSFLCKTVLVKGGERGETNQEYVIIEYGKFLMSVLTGKNVTYASLIWKGIQDGLLGQISLADEL